MYTYKSPFYLQYALYRHSCVCKRVYFHNDSSYLLFNQCEEAKPILAYYNDLLGCLIKLALILRNTKVTNLMTLVNYSIN
jgi:hypothetical protein